MAQNEREQRVSPLELFFDLVFVFAFTRVTTFLSHNPTWGGLLRALLILSMLWWAWSGYAWLTNNFDPEKGDVRLVVLSASAAMLIAALAVPHTFGSDGVIFAIAYLVVRGLHLVLFTIAGRGDRDLLGAVTRIAPSAVIGSVMLLVAGFLHGSAQLALWCAAVAATYLGALVGHMQGWRVSAAHFVERFGLIIIIALGESIVAIGVGGRSLSLGTSVIEAALLGFTVTACLWWSYFDWFAYVAQARLTEATGAERAALARDAFTYLHLPMVAGIVLFAFGLKTVVSNVSGSLHIVPAVGLFGGIALYMLAHVVVRLRVGGGWGRGRPVATVVLLALLPIATHISSLAALGLVAAVSVALIVYEFLRHHASRDWIRNRRGDFTLDEARQAIDEERSRRADRPRGRRGP
jgi:low temperature requirement protein LtrA